MPYAIDLSKDPFFSKEFARAKTQGEAIGEAKGKATGKAEVITGLLENGRFSVEEIAEFSKMPIEFVLQVQKKFNLSQKASRKKKIMPLYSSSKT